MLNELETLFQLPLYKTILLFIASIMCLIFNMEFKKKGRHGISDAFYILGSLTFIGFLVMLYKFLKG